MKHKKVLIISFSTITIITIFSLVIAVIYLSRKNSSLEKYTASISSNQTSSVTVSENIVNDENTVNADSIENFTPADSNGISATPTVSPTQNISSSTTISSDTSIDTINTSNTPNISTSSRPSALTPPHLYTQSEVDNFVNTIKSFANANGLTEISNNGIGTLGGKEEFPAVDTCQENETLDAKYAEQKANILEAVNSLKDGEKGCYYITTNPRYYGPYGDELNFYEMWLYFYKE